jgi:hypothetical protein
MTMNELMVSFQRWARSADDDINLFLVGGLNCAGNFMSHEGHDGNLLVWALKLDPSLHQDIVPLESSHQGLSIGVKKT